jgi:hypothetical protein
MPENYDEKETKRPTSSPESASFPLGMIALAAIFDLIGIIPIINLFSELLAGLTLGLWQKSYAPKTDPVTTFLVAKVIDIFSLGILPSNIGIVVYAYIKKKAAT